MSVYDTVKPIMDRYGIPDYIWVPIMMSESGGNPSADTGNLPKERSVGLFQINLKAHPQWSMLNLKDPAVNAEIAAKYFLSGAFSAAQKRGLSPEDQTAYVWRYGIRPAWTDAKAASIKEKTRKVLSNGGGITVPSFSPVKDDPTIAIGSSWEGAELSGWQVPARVGAYVLIGIAALVILILAIPKPIDVAAKQIVDAVVHAPKKVWKGA